MPSAEPRQLARFLPPDHDPGGDARKLWPYPSSRWSLELEGQTYHLKREEDRIWADLPHPSMGRIKRRIVLTTGSHHFQMYWFSSGSTRKLELFPFVYAIQEGRWIPEKSTFLMPPSPRISTQPGRWNQACLQCHTTLGRPRVATQDNMDTQVAEFGIACEACHGPGARHVQVMNRPGSLEAYRSGKLELEYRQSRQAAPRPLLPGLRTVPQRLHLW